jgi:predicted HTH transcriptional regulator
MVHENSTLAHHEHESSGRGATYREKIVALLTRNGLKMTDRQIIETLQVTDVNNVRPEITRLKQAGVLEEVGKIKCPVTGHAVRQVRIKRI